ncbi:MAG: DUF502 domain-containing protein, partial [Mucilaginibacter sp.]
MKKLFGILLNYFVKGIIVVLPVGAALFLIYWGVYKLDSALNLSGFFLTDSKGNPIYIPGMGILNVLVIILVVGILVTNVVTDPIKRWANRWINRLPIFKFLYSSIKDLTEAFVGEEKKFNEPVLVEVN